MALAIATVADSISKISVSGLVIKDIDQIPAGVDGRQPTMIPLPDYLTDFNMERDSFGGGSTALMTVTYRLNYRLCYKPAGSGRSNALDWFDNMVAMVGLILDAVLAIEVMTGTIDIVPVNVFNVGLVNDPADNAFYGADLSFQVKEFVNG